MSFQLRLDQALSTWREWKYAGRATPTVLKKIKQGLTNQSFLLDCGEFLAILRLNYPEYEKLGINRYHEYKTLQALAYINICPKILYWPGDHSFAVFEYIDGRVWSSRDFRSSTQRNLLKKTILTYQKVKPDISDFDYIVYLERYRIQLQKQHPKKMIAIQNRLRKLRQRLKLYQLTNFARVLTHHDLVPENIVETKEGLRVIDWEYSGMGLPGVDEYYIQSKSARSNAIPAVKDIVGELVYCLDKLWWEIR